MNFSQQGHIDVVGLFKAIRLLLSPFIFIGRIWFKWLGWALVWLSVKAVTLGKYPVEPISMSQQDLPPKYKTAVGVTGFVLMCIMFQLVIRVLDAA